MQKAKIIRNERVVLAQGLFIIEIKAYEVPKSSKFPEGVKLKCVLIDVEQGKPRVLLDNHQPYGFHLHAKLPDDPNFRVELDILDYHEAIRVFMKEVRKVISNES